MFKTLYHQSLRELPQIGLFVSAIALNGLCGLAHAQSLPPVLPNSVMPTFVIKGFDITGDNPLPAGEVSTILAPFLRTDATMETLQKATAALEQALKDKGFGLHRVALPPQEVGQSVTLNIVKFVIGKVIVEGNDRISVANIRSSLPELVEGQAPNFNTLAVQTTIANESQGKKIQIALKESEEADKIDARIVVKEARPWNFAASLSNAGSSTTGQDRLTLAGGHSNLFDRDHQLTAAYTTSLQSPSAVRQFGLNYRAPLYSLSGVLGANLTHSDLAGDFGTFSSTGAGSTLGLSYAHYLAPVAGYRGSWELGLDHKQFDVTQINGTPLAGQEIRRSVPLTFGYSGKMETDNSLWGFSTNLAMNLPVAGGQNLASYQSEDPRVSTVQWKALRGGGHYATGLSSGWLWSVRGQFQYSPDALISGEQFGLGGGSSVRGTSERPLAGDSGILVSTEITSPELTTGLRLIGFVDAGWLGNTMSVSNAKPAQDSLASVGVGLRYTISNYSLSADYGRVITGSSVSQQTVSGLPQAGDYKLHINMAGRF